MSPKSRRPVHDESPAISATGPGALRRVMGSGAGFATIVEPAPWAGDPGDARR